MCVYTLTSPHVLCLFGLPRKNNKRQLCNFPCFYVYILYEKRNIFAHVVDLTIIFGSFWSGHYKLFWSFSFALPDFALLFWFCFRIFSWCCKFCIWSNCITVYAMYYYIKQSFYTMRKIAKIQLNIKLLVYTDRVSFCGHSLSITGLASSVTNIKRTSSRKIKTMCLVNKLTLNYLGLDWGKIRGVSLKT